jgi:hypothetical protein
MSIDVSVNDVLRRRSKRFERLIEFFPIARTIQSVRGIGIVPSWIESGPAQRVTLAITLENYWAMPRHGDVVGDDVVLGAADAFPDFDLFVPDHGILPTRGCLILFRIIGIELLDIEILNVWSNIREAPRDSIVVTDNHAG